MCQFSLEPLGQQKLLCGQEWGGSHQGTQWPVAELWQVGGVRRCVSSESVLTVTAGQLLQAVKVLRPLVLPQASGGSPYTHHQPTLPHILTPSAS